jgi:hypothetical protein
MARAQGQGVGQGGSVRLTVFAVHLLIAGRSRSHRGSHETFDLIYLAAIFSIFFIIFSHRDARLYHSPPAPNYQ